MMSEEEIRIIRSAHAEASSAAIKKGLFGEGASQAVMAATIKVATRILGRPISAATVQKVVAR